MLGSVLVQAWMLDGGGARGGFAALTLLAAITALWASVLMAKLCSAAASALRGEPGLPEAKVVSGP
jgi:hypothetical protein